MAHNGLPPNKRTCFHCGNEVSEFEYDFIGRAMVGLCYSRICQRAIHEANAQADEEARYQAERDNYDRYR